MTITTTTTAAARPASASLSPVALPLLVGATLYLILIARGGSLLNDPDTYWHIALGRWMIEHGAVPTVDTMSATMAGTHWLAFEWLSDVLYAAAHSVAGWSGVVMLAAAAVAVAFAVVSRFLMRSIPPLPALVLVTAAFVLAAPHVLARPHVLALPVLAVWTAALVGSVDRGRSPPLWLVAVMVLWANLHGSFTLGLLLIVPLGLEAAWLAAPGARRALALRWLGFAALALLASALNPYGPEMIAVTWRTLTLGDALSIIDEWRPQDFAQLGGFEIMLLLGIGYALVTGLRLPWTRIVMLLGVLHLALSQSRHGDILAMTAPLFLARPLAGQLGPAVQDTAFRLWSAGSAATAALLAAATAALVVFSPWSPDTRITPAAAIAATDLAHNGPLLNGYNFGGYLDFVGIPPFIDGRQELYGSEFVLRLDRALNLQNIPGLLKLLDQYAIRTTLLAPGTPAVGLLDTLPGWKRIYADDVAVVHRRETAPAVAQP